MQNILDFTYNFIPAVTHKVNEKGSVSMLHYVQSDASVSNVTLTFEPQTLFTATEPLVLSIKCVARDSSYVACACSGEGGTVDTVQGFP